MNLVCVVAFALIKVSEGVHNLELFFVNFLMDVFSFYSSLVPGKIRMLKTKCYMKMKDWKKALEAAEEAMFRLFEAQGEDGFWPIHTKVLLRIILRCPLLIRL